MIETLKKEKEHLERTIENLSKAIEDRSSDGIRSYEIESGAGSRKVSNMTLKELMTAKEQCLRKLSEVTKEIERKEKGETSSRFVRTVFK